MSKYCFSMLCAPDLEESLLDSLLVTFDADVFTSAPVSSHGTLAGRLTASEQVMGRSRSVLVQVIVTSAESNQLRELLRKDFAGSGVRYWMTELSDEGGVA